MKVVVCNKAGGGVFVEETTGKGKDAKTVVVKKLPGETVELSDDKAAELMDKQIVKPCFEGTPAPAPAKE